MERIVFHQLPPFLPLCGATGFGNPPISSQLQNQMRYSNLNYQQTASLTHFHEINSISNQNGEGGGGVRQHGHPPVAGTRDVTIQRLFLRFFSEILGILVMADADNLLEQKKKKRKEHKRMKRNGQ